MGFTVSKFGDWTRAGVVLQTVATKLCPAFKVQLTDDGDFVLKTLQGHIDAQDLPWTPLSPKTIEIKGNSTIYVDSGYLRGSLEVRKVRAPANGITLFVGASAWKTSPSGVKFSDLMIWLEYGNEKMPPRPLIRPTWEEVEPILQEHWSSFLSDFIKSGGS